ncbi:MAG: threonine synthase, partial [Pelagibacteraceae bacterium]
MRYVSTRNNNKDYSFKEVFLKGLADDGGLFIPQSLFKFNEKDLTLLKDLDYKELAQKIIQPFVSDFINENDLSLIINKSYSVFRKKNVVELLNLGNRQILELFHGPTLAFKDIAMQLLGNFYEYYLKSENKKINIIVATSGDTGAAAIEAIKGQENLNIFVLHPLE